VCLAAVQDGAAQLLSLCFRLYCQNRASATVLRTASATVRQAVALVFDHTECEVAAAAAAAAAAGGGSGGSALFVAAGGAGGATGSSNGRVAVAMLLLQDLHGMCAGGGRSVQVHAAAAPPVRAPVCTRTLPGCLKNTATHHRNAGHPPSWLKCPLVARGFVLDLLEFVLLHRPAVFHTHADFKALLQKQVRVCVCMHACMYVSAHAHVLSEASGGGGGG
jgi:hypothetical protein